MANPLLKAAIPPRRHSETCALGWTDAECEWMVRQAGLLEQATRDIFVRAGLGPGMRVLDFGCGMGDVTLLAASLVGADGQVTGVDRDTRAIRGARARVGSLPVDFEVCDLDELPRIERLGKPFDAVVGRFVLCHQPDPAAALRKIVSVLRPGSLIVFVEPELELGLGLNSDFPETMRCTHLIVETLRRGGVHLNLGTQLPRIFHEAGLPWPATYTHIVMANGTDLSGYNYCADTAEVLLRHAENFGIATANEVNLNGLAERIRQEAFANGRSLLSHLIVGAWVECVGAHPDMLVFR